LRRKQRESNVGTSDSDLFFDICLKISDGSPICRRMETENWQLSATIKSPQNYDILAKMWCFCTSFSAMKEKTTDTGAVLDFGALPYATHTRLTVPVTILKGKNPRPVRHMTLSELLAEIETTTIAKLNHAKAMVIAYEQYLQNVEKGIEYPKKGYETEKDQLYGFQLGHFSYRNDENESCLEYVPCQVFDLDGCQSTYDVFLFREKLKELAYVFAAFASPSGYGLRILIWTNATYDTHIAIYLQILEKLCIHLGVTTDKRNGTHFDTTCKNQSRHFYYVAIDPKAFYLHLESQTLEIQIAAPVIKEKVLPPVEKKAILSPKVPSSDSYTYIDALNDEVKIEYLLKNMDMNKPRKIQCFYFGCVCRENKVDFEAARRTAVHRFYDSEQKNPEKVIEAQLKDGYNYSQVRYDDAQFIAFLRNTHNVIIKSNKNPVTTTDAIIEQNGKVLDLENKYPSDTFYAHLPQILKQCTDALKNDMDKHVFFNGALSTLSSLMGCVSGIYDGKRLYPSFYTYIVATGGAGKGALDYARQIVLGVARKIQEDNEKGDSKKTLFLPTNIGNTQFVQKLAENKGIGLFFETEGCIVAKMSKSENMDLSDTLRKGYHHEMLLLARKTEKIDIYIPTLRLSVLISGTLSQLFPTIKDGEDGLLSRFNYLFLSGNYQFKNVFDRDQNQKQMQVFHEISEKMVLLYELLQNRTITFELTELQEQHFVATFQETKAYMMDYCEEKGEKSKEIFSGIMNRIGVICFRTAMILTVLRSFEENQFKIDNSEGIQNEIIVCNEMDFKTAMDFAELSRNNAYAVFNRLPQPKIQSIDNTADINKAEFKAKHFQEAFELSKKGKSYAEIAKIIFGDEKLKGTIHRWLH
jgi:hypothetical protein